MPATTASTLLTPIAKWCMSECPFNNRFTETQCENFLSHVLVALLTITLYHFICKSSSKASSSSSSSKPTNTSCAPEYTASTSWLQSISTRFSEFASSPPSSSLDKSKFMAVFDDLTMSILDVCRSNEMPAAGIDWIRDMIRYTVVGGKLNRGLQVIIVQRTLSKSNTLSDLEFARASILGWSIEFLQAFFLVADDVMDDSVTRRGQPCWYKRGEVGMIAINDSFLLESFVFTLLKQYFGHETYYMKLVELFINVVQKTEFGQLLDLTSQPQENGAFKIELERFTLERYSLIVKYKTAYYTFYLPIAIGMITSGITDEKAFKVCEEVCCAMGEYFQVQDDFLDCYGDAATIGKIGTDIQDNKCSWLIVQALKRASAKQKDVLAVNYGRDEPKKIAKVKAVYEEIGMQKIFDQYENDSYALIQEKLGKVESFMPRDIFELLLKKIYKRSK